MKSLYIDDTESEDFNYKIKSFHDTLSNYDLSMQDPKNRSSFLEVPSKNFK